VSENSIGQAEENYRVTNEKFRNGLVLSSELLDAEVALLQANTNYIQSLVDYELAKARLEKSSGMRRSK
jgi:outer membrane protein